jgi:hypothetical protein
MKLKVRLTLVVGLSHMRSTSEDVKRREEVKNKKMTKFSFNEKAVTSKEVSNVVGSINLRAVEIYTRHKTFVRIPKIVFTAPWKFISIMTVL